MGVGWEWGEGGLRIGDAGKSVSCLNYPQIINGFKPCIIPADYKWVQTMYYLCIITVSQTFVVVF